MAREQLALDMTADPTRFAEACDDFASRAPITREEADAIDDYARRRSFWITGVAEMDMLDTIQQSITKALEDGVDFRKWKKEIGPLLTEAWGKRDSHRLETVFINATQQAYNAGRWQQALAPHVRAVRPYAMFDGVNDSRQTDICRECDGTTLPIGDPWWATHSPQLHHRCRSGIRTLRTATAEKQGVTMYPPDTAAAQGWGANPLLAEPPRPAQRERRADRELETECYAKAAKAAERKSVTIPKRNIT